MTQVTSANPTSCRVSIVVPVYNEKDKAAQLLQGIVAAMHPMSCPWELIVVDDGSNDGTVEQLH